MTQNSPSIAHDAREARSEQTANSDVRKLDVDWVRGQFPAFSDPQLNGWAHLENAGGSYAARHVRDIFFEFYTSCKVQPYYEGDPSKRAGAAMDRAKSVVPAILNAAPDEVMFGPSTSANVYVLSHALREQMEDGDEIIVTNQEHESNGGAWRRLEKTGITVKEWRVDPTTGLLDMDDLRELISPRTRLIAVNHASNVAATINPIRQIADLIHQAGGLLVVDGVSYAPHSAVDVRALDCDFYMFSAYKTFGPHVGVLYARGSVLRTIPNQGHHFNGSMPTYRLTPAAPNHAEIAACAGMIEYYRDVYAHHLGVPDSVDDVALVRDSFSLFAEHEQLIMRPLAEFLMQRDGVRLIGAQSAEHARREPTFAVHSDRVDTTQVYQRLVEAKINCGLGPFDANRLLSALGIDPDAGVLRLSLSHYNTEQEVSRALEVLDRHL